MFSFLPPTPARLAVTLAAAGLLVGCGMAIPADPDGTLDRVLTSGQLKVGVSIQPPFTTPPTTPGAAPAGTEVELVAGFAESIGAEPLWVVGGEESLVKRLEEGEVHVLVGGLTATSPWGKQVAFTRPYATTSEEGEKVDRVMAAIPGENALLAELERYLDGALP